MPDPDVLIVGAGAAGCVLAGRLSQDPACEVLLLEAVPDLRSRMPAAVRSGWRPTRSFDWGYASEPDEHGTVVMLEEWLECRWMRLVAGARMRPQVAEERDCRSRRRNDERDEIDRGLRKATAEHGGLTCQTG